MCFEYDRCIFETQRELRVCFDRKVLDGHEYSGGTLSFEVA
jgi:hypothetical protein